MGAPQPSRPPPKPRPRTACEQRIDDDRMCPETDTAIVPAFGDLDYDNHRSRKQWRLCAKHREQHLAECAGGERMLWALRQVIRAEIERANGSAG